MAGAAAACSKGWLCVPINYIYMYIVYASVFFTAKLILFVLLKLMVYLPFTDRTYLRLTEQEFTHLPADVSKVAVRQCMYCKTLFIREDLIFA